MRLPFAVAFGRCRPWSLTYWFMQQKVHDNDGAAGSAASMSGSGAQGSAFPITDGGGAVEGGGSARDAHFMGLALEEARLAALFGEVPVGAVVVRGDEVLAASGNRRERDQDPCGHAELIAIRAAAKAVGSWRLEGCDVYVTLEPCPMCAGAMVLSRVQRVAYGCPDPKGGFLGSLADLSGFPGLNHRFAVSAGIEGERCSEQLRQFFRDLRAVKRRARLGGAP